MPTYRKADYWGEYNLAGQRFFRWSITGKDIEKSKSCGIIKGDRLVMGAGTAQQVRDRFPGIDLAIGRKLMSDFDYEGKPIIYGLLISDRWPVGKVGASRTS
jgi:hypothetical protein